MPLGPSQGSIIVNCWTNLFRSSLLLALLPQLRRSNLFLLIDTLDSICFLLLL